MKILCSPPHGALNYIMRGWKEVFENIGYEWHWWPTDKPAFDAFDEVDPDIVFLTNQTCTNATLKCLKERPDTHVAIKVGNWGSMDSDLASFHEKAGIPKEQYPVHIATAEEKAMVKEIMGVVNTQSFVYGLYHPNRLEGTLEGWAEIAPVLGIMPAACLYHDKPVEYSNDLSCEIGFVGGYWPYKAVNLDKYIVPLCNGDYNVKIFGNSGWPVPQWLGSASDEIVRQLFSSALICPNVSEPHANEFGFEVNERVFKLAASGAFCISDKIASLEEDVFYNHEMVIADDPDHFQDLVRMYVQNHDLTDAVIKPFDTVMSNHTYFDRAIQVLTAFGLETETCYNEKDKLVKERIYDFEK